MEFSKEYNNLPNKLVVDPSLINITDSESDINFTSNTIVVTSDGSNNIANLDLVGKYTTQTSNTGNAKLHIGAYKDNSGKKLNGGGITFFTQANSTDFSFSNVSNPNNSMTFYRTADDINEEVFHYANGFGNGIQFKTKVGIFGNEPTAPLHIENVSSGVYIFTKYFDPNNASVTSIPSGEQTNEVDVAILLNPPNNAGNIGMNGKIYNYSDERIKTDIEDVPDNLALSQINNIEPKYYHYKNPLQKRDVKTIGFIAQNVNQHLPNAVNKMTDFIPNALKNIVESDWSENNGKFSIVLDNLNLDASNSTKRVKFIVSDNDDCADAFPLIISCENDNKTFVFDKKWNKMFVYGSEVNDLHTIDKAQIFALHHSGIQELSKQLNEKDAKITALENENTTIKQRLEALEASVLALQNN